ncbi:MAG: TrmB family transcriptional regulator [Ardenticatenaceae bacterium]|nr:TrmB family transcriptional regulator [Ardenticatenaceae bacterium]MCB9445825.1 TrmB family transcriptional regulator [Ardenticatenaceae bacterium]
MSEPPIDKLLKIGFSEYEAKAYMALLSKNPVSGYELAKISGVPRSMIYEVLGKLTARGAAMTLHMGNVTKYAPFPAEEFLVQMQREHTELIDSLKEELTSFAEMPELEYVWNIEGDENITAKALEMIGQAKRQIYLALRPATFPVLQTALAEAITRKVRVVIYTTDNLDLPGAQVRVAHVAEETLEQARGLGLILVVDGEEVLIGEWLTAVQAWASWTRSPLFVFLAEHHLRTDLYLPQILAELGEQALNLIQEEDRDLFARALESHLSG